MAKQYRCPDCDVMDIPPENETTVVLVNSGGVHRHLICRTHNTELEYECDVETEYVGHEDPDNNYQIAEDNNE